MRYSNTYRILRKSAVRKFLFVAFALSWGVLGQAQTTKSWWSKLDREFIKKITLSGYRSLSYHDHL